MAKVIVFGQRDYAEQADYYLTHDSPHEVVAFAVTADQLGDKTFRGRPLVAFEEVQDSYPPEDHRFFVPMSGREMNGLRARFFAAAKAKGYALISYVSSKAILCHNDIGENCFILEKNNLQPFVRVGDNVTLWCGNHIGHHSVIEDHVYMGSHCVISGRCRIGASAYLASMVLVDMNVRVAEGTLLGIGTVVKRDTEPWSIYTGNPARKRKISSRDFAFL